MDAQRRSNRLWEVGLRSLRGRLRRHRRSEAEDSILLEDDAAQGRAVTSVSTRLRTFAGARLVSCHRLVKGAGDGLGLSTSPAS